MLNRKQIWTLMASAGIAGGLYETIGLIWLAFFVLVMGATLAYKLTDVKVRDHQEHSVGEDMRAIRDTGHSATQSSLEPTPERVRSGYLQLLDLVQHDGEPSALKHIIDSYEFELPINAESILMELASSFDDITSHFIMRLDWKAGVEDLNWHFDAALAGCGNTPTLPNPDRYPPDASILHGLDFSNPGTDLSVVFDEYLLALNRAGYGLCFLDSQSDEFVLILYRLPDRQAVIDAVFNAGLSIGLGQ